MTSPKNSSPLEIRLTEIGRVHSPFKQATGTPIQPYRAGSAPGYVTLRPEFVDGLADLDMLARANLIEREGALNGR